MKSFRQFKTQITELFDKPARWKMTANRPSYVGYESNVNSQNLSVSFYFVDDEYDHWSVTFATDLGTDVTGEGDEIAIFSTVLDIIDDFVTLKNPEKLFFLADKSKAGRDSRIRLYDRLIRRYAPSIGFKLEDRFEYEGSMVYTLSKI